MVPRPVRNFHKHFCHGLFWKDDRYRAWKCGGLLCPHCGRKLIFSWLWATTTPSVVISVTWNLATWFVMLFKHLNWGKILILIISWCVNIAILTYPRLQFALVSFTYTQQQMYNRPPYIMLSATHHVKEQYEEMATASRVQLIVGKRSWVSEVAVETSEISCSLLKAGR